MCLHACVRRRHPVSSQRHAHCLQEGYSFQLDVVFFQLRHTDLHVAISHTAQHCAGHPIHFFRHFHVELADFVIAWNRGRNPGVRVHHRRHLLTLCLGIVGLHQHLDPDFGLFCVEAQNISSRTRFRAFNLRRDFEIRIRMLARLLSLLLLHALLGLQHPLLHLFERQDGVGLFFGIDVDEASPIEVDDLNRAVGLFLTKAAALDRPRAELRSGRLSSILAKRAQEFDRAHHRAACHLAAFRVLKVGMAGNAAADDNGDQYCEKFPGSHIASPKMRSTL